MAQVEAVHPLAGWDDMKRRVGAYRRVYMFTHPAIPGEPVVLIFVALLPNIADNIQVFCSFALFKHPRRR